MLKKISAKSNAVERTFNVYRYDVGGKKLTDNDISRILVESRDSAERRAAWEARMTIGRAVIADLKAVVALRNEAARKLGFKNFHAMQLYLNEQSDEQVLKLFDELDELTREPYHKAKAEIDAALAKSYGITVDELRPWHYHDPYFAEVPAVLGDLPESVYKPIDIAQDLPRVLRRHRAADRRRAEAERSVREAGQVPARLLDRHRPRGRRPHLGEHRARPRVAGHDVARVGPRLVQQEPSAHVALRVADRGPSADTEGVAMMFERFAQNVDWLQAMGAKVPEPEQFRAAAAKLQRNRLLIFARWCQVMFRFERELYANPDQDLNRLWWDLVEKYQEVKRPAGPQRARLRRQVSISSAPRPTTTTTCWASCSPRRCITP